MQRRRLVSAVAAASAALAVVAVTTGSTSTPTPNVTKVLTFIEENHSLSQMQTGMPYLYSQAKRYGYANHYTAVTHPSLPNYLAMIGGSTFGVTDDAGPSSHPETSPNVFNSALATGHTAKSWQEGMTSPCLTTNSGRYAVKHNPWAYFPANRVSCQANDLSAGTYTTGNLHNAIVNGTLPTIGQVTPDLCNDAHDCSLGTADNWLTNWLKLIYTSPDWKSGHLAVIVTADEDDRSSGNTVLTTVIHPRLTGKVVTTPLTHYSWNRAQTDLARAACIRNGCTATDLWSAFGLTVR